MLPPLNGRWRHAEGFSEYTAEVRRTREPPGDRAVRDRLAPAGFKFLTAVLQSRSPDIITNGHASLAEQHVQIAFGAAQRGGNLVNAKIRVAQMFANEGLCPHIHRLRTRAVEGRIRFA